MGTNSKNEQASKPVDGAPDVSKAAEPVDAGVAQAPERHDHADSYDVETEGYEQLTPDFSAEETDESEDVLDDNTEEESK